MCAPAACETVRVHEPNQFLQTLPGVFAEATTGSLELDSPVPGEDRVFIIQRPLLGRADIPFLKELLARDYLIVVEMDDDPLDRLVL